MKKYIFVERTRPLQHYTSGTSDNGVHSKRWENWCSRDDVTCTAQPSPMPPFTSKSAAEAEFEAFVRENTNALRQFFRKRVAVQADVEDMVQEVLIKLARHGLEDISHQQGYLFRTALNVLRDQRRNRAARLLQEQLPLDEDYADEDGFTPERVLISKDALCKLGEILQEIPGRTREVFALSRISGLTNAEVAKRLGISVSAVEKHLSRATMNLSERFLGLL